MAVLNKLLYDRVQYEYFLKLFKGEFMKNKMGLRDKIIMQAGLLFLYVMSEWGVSTLLSDTGSSFNLKMECLKIIMFVGINLFATFLFTVIKRLDSRKTFSVFVGIESIMISLVILYAILKRYYGLYGKQGFEIGFIYIIVAVILFLLYKDFYKKLPSEKELNGKKKEEPKKGLAYASAACVISVGRLMTIQQYYIMNILIVLMISCGWLILGWYMFQAKKRYLDNLEEDNE